ncbi:MAG: dihydropteroate synthase [Phycisphaeraceae bacterium]
MKTPASDQPPILMGVLNVTPDSFCDGGRFADIDKAVAHGLRMAHQGAAIIDVGGESTRPGSARVNAEEQIKRVIEPIRCLRQALDDEGFQHVTISIDTTLADVAEAALDAGAAMLNDVSAGREDMRMLRLAGERGVPIALMHMQGQPGTMQQDPRYNDVVAEVLAFLLDRAEAARSAGVALDKVWLDPGIGFGKTLEHNLQLLRQLDTFVATGHPVLLGVSRKRFIAGCCPDAPGIDRPENRLPGTLAAGLVGVRAGVAALRVHDVAEHAQALAVWQSAKLNTSQTNRR